MVYRYVRNVAVRDDELVTLDIVLPDLGSAGNHLVDLPGPNDQSGLNSCRIILGTGAQLKAERTVVFSRPINIDPNNNEVKAEYLINGQSIQMHQNLKTADVSPQVILTIIFS